MANERGESHTNEEQEKWIKEFYNHVCDPESRSEFNALDENLLCNEEAVGKMLETLDNVAYGGWGDYAIVVRGKKMGHNIYPIHDVIKTGIISLEVGMGQRLIQVSNPIYNSVWGRSAYYIPWPDGSPKFESGRKGNRIVSLNLKDLSRSQPDVVIE